MEIITEANHLTITSFTNSVKVGVFSRKVKTRWESLLRGKPLTAAFVMFMLLPDLAKQEGMQAYRLITDKGMDSRLKDVVEWALGIAEGGVPAEAPDTEAVSHVGDTVESNTEAILTLMEDLSTFKKEIHAKMDRQYQDMLNHIAVQSSDTAGITEVRIGKQNKALESRIKALEDAVSARLSGDDVSLMAGLEARQAVEAMGEELRSDISNAFDALAAEQPSGDVSSNPLAALEQVKAALKAAGFKGTLTLTIE